MGEICLVTKKMKYYSEKQIRIQIYWKILCNTLSDQRFLLKSLQLSQTTLTKLQLKIKFQKSVNFPIIRDIYST